jgi:hypothetical protein
VCYPSFLSGRRSASMNITHTASHTTEYSGFESVRYEPLGGGGASSLDGAQDILGNLYSERLFNFVHL